MESWENWSAGWGKMKQLMDFMCTSVLWGFLCGSAGKESTCNAGDLGLISGLERSPGEKKVYPLQYSDLENSMDGIVHGVSKSWTWLSHFHFFCSLRINPSSCVSSLETVSSAQIIQICICIKFLERETYDAFKHLELYNRIYNKSISNFSSCYIF